MRVTTAFNKMLDLPGLQMLTFGEEALIVEVRYAQEHIHANAKAQRRLRLLIGGNIR